MVEKSNTFEKEQWLKNTIIHFQRKIGRKNFPLVLFKSRTYVPHSESTIKIPRCVCVSLLPCCFDPSFPCPFPSTALPPTRSHPPSCRFGTAMWEKAKFRSYRRKKKKKKKKERPPEAGIRVCLSDVPLKLEEEWRGGGREKETDQGDTTRREKKGNSGVRRRSFPSATCLLYLPFPFVF